jgi:hypothetical protein
MDGSITCALRNTKDAASTPPHIKVGRIGSGSRFGYTPKRLDANVDKQLRSFLRDPGAHFLQRDRPMLAPSDVAAADRQDSARFELLNITQPRYAVCLSIENLADRDNRFPLMPIGKNAKLWLTAGRFAPSQFGS